MEFTKQQRVEAYKKLSEQLKEFVMSDELAKTFQIIGSAHNLLLDKVDIMADAVIIVLIGLVSSSEFPKKLSVVLNMSGSALENLLEDINNKIFIPFRNSLKAEAYQEAYQEEKNDGGAVDELNKESILAEIENPTAVVHPISIADQTIAGPAQPREIIMTPREEKTGGKNGIENRDTVTSEFIAGKLTETVSLPSQKINVNPESMGEKPKNYIVDPYRESIK